MRVFIETFLKITQIIFYNLNTRLCHALLSKIPPKFPTAVLSWDSNSPRSQLWLTILTCFGAGVILTTTVTHMMPEVSHFIRYNIEHGIQE